MRAALYVGEERITVDDIDVADPKPGQVRVRVRHCGVCHSDYSMTTSGFGRVPLVLGHEATGIVDAVGTGVIDLRPGDKVVLSPTAACGRCRSCVRGHAGGCVVNKGVFSSTFADGSTGLSRGSEVVYRGMNVGGFAEMALVSESGAVKVPDDTPLEIACLIGCAVQTGVGAALNTADIAPGDSVLVIGAGGIGLAVIQGARIAGASTVILSDPNANRRAMARQLGATHLVDPSSDDLLSAVKDLTGGAGVDTAFEASGVGALQIVAVDATGSGGSTVLVGAPPVEHTLKIPMALVWGMAEKKLLGCFMGSSNSRRDIPRLLKLWRAGQLNLESMISARRPLDQINDSIADLVAGVGIRTVIDL